MQILVQILQRAAPFSLGFLGMLLMGTVDLLFVGKMGAASLAAMGLAHSIVN
jgi:Na+-driven multidrug efflux pump